MKRFFVAALLVVGVVFLSGPVQADLNDGLMAYYPFNGNANDESGNGNHGTVNGAALTNDRNDKVKAAFYFNGNNSIVLPNSTRLTGSQTISMWVKPEKIVGISLFGGCPACDNSGYGIGCGWSSRIDAFSCNAHDMQTRPYSNSRIANENGFVIDEWSHFVASYSAETSTIRMFINGDEVAYTNQQSGDFSEIVWGNKSLRLGASSQSYFSPFVGALDEVRIYNRALSASEVQQLFTQDNDSGGDNNTYPPVITSFTSSTTMIPEKDMVSFSCEAYDPDGGDVSYKFEISDGSYKYDSDGKFEYPFNTVGIYKVTCIATDDEGDSVTSSPITIEVSAFTDPKDCKGNLLYSFSESYKKAYHSYCYTGYPVDTEQVEKYFFGIEAEVLGEINIDLFYTSYASEVAIKLYDSACNLLEYKKLIRDFKEPLTKNLQPGRYYIEVDQSVDEEDACAELELNFMPNTASATCGCVEIEDDYTMTSGNMYFGDYPFNSGMVLKKIVNVSDISGNYWKLESLTDNSCSCGDQKGNSPCPTVHDDFSITIPCLKYKGSTYQIYMELLLQPNGNWKLDKVIQ